MSQGGGPSLGDVVSAAALALGLITAWLYATGWSYSYHYFDRFRIPMLMTELPREHLFVYRGLVLWKNLIFTALAGLAVVGLTRHMRPLSRALDALASQPSSWSPSCSKTRGATARLSRFLSRL